MASRWVSQLLTLGVWPRGGRPQIDAELRALIAQMSADNPLWGAPRIHGELLKLGFEVAQSMGATSSDGIAHALHSTALQSLQNS